MSKKCNYWMCWWNFSCKNSISIEFSFFKIISGIDCFIPALTSNNPIYIDKKYKLVVQMLFVFYHKMRILTIFLSISCSVKRKKIFSKSDLLFYDKRWPKKSYLIIMHQIWAWKNCWIGFSMALIFGPKMIWFTGVCFQSTSFRDTFYLLSFFLDL